MLGMIRLFNLGPTKHEEGVISVANQRIPNVCRIAGAACCGAIRNEIFRWHQLGAKDLLTPTSWHQKTEAVINKRIFLLLTASVFFSHFSSCSLTINTYQYFLRLSNEKWLQFTRIFLWADFMLAWKSACMNVRRERHFMSKNELRSSGERWKRGFANGAEWTVTKYLLLVLLPSMLLNACMGTQTGHGQQYVFDPENLQQCFSSRTLLFLCVEIEN